MKGFKKMLSFVVALSTVASSAVYAQSEVTGLEKVLYDGMTAVVSNECDAADSWSADAAGGSCTVEDGKLIIAKNESANARATYTYAAEGDIYLETKLSTNGSTRVEVFSKGGTLANYTDISEKNGINVNKGIEPDSHTNINIGKYTSGEEVVIGWYFSPSKDTYDVYVNGELKSQKCPMRMMADFVSFASVRVTSLDVGTVTSVDYVNGYTVNEKENAAPTISDVAISGIASYGRKLSAEYAYADADGDCEGETEYQWFISGSENGKYSEIAGAVRSKYSPSADVDGKYIKVVVTPVDIFGNEGKAVESAPVKATAQKDVIYQSTFDDNDVWTTAKSGSNYIAELTDNGENEKYLRVGTTAKDSHAMMNKALNFTGNFTVEFTAKIPTINNGANRTHLLTMTQKTAGGNKTYMDINCYDQKAGDPASCAVRVITSGGNKSVGVDLTTWKRFKMDVNMTNKTMTLYVDGETSATWTNMPLGHADCTETDPIVSMGIGMNAANTANSADIRVKDIEIYKVLPYNTAPSAEDFVVKGVSAVGSALYADYVYTDAEGDNEAAGNIKWYMSGSEDGEYTLIEGADGLSYEIPAEYAGAYIKAVVTPKDYLGAAGETVESDAFYVDYLTGDEITLTNPYGVKNQCTTGSLTGEGNSYTFTSADATQNRWIWGWTAFTGPAVMGFKVKNPDAVAATLNIPNGEYGIFSFENGKFSYIDLGGTIVIADTIDKNHTYDVRLVINELTGSTTDYANLYVDGKLIKKVNARRAVTSIANMNIYLKSAGSLEISDFAVENIITEYPDFKVVSEDMFKPSAAGEPYEYSFVVKNASGNSKDFVAVLALYKTVDGVEVLESVDIYDDGLDLGETSVYLTVTPKDADATYTAQIIKLDSFDTLKPSDIK